MGLIYNCSNIKPVFTHIGHSPHEQIIIVERDVPYFNTPFHFHPELEMVYILEGYGKRIVGDSVAAFNPGELILLGSNISHVWYSDEIYYHGNPDLRSRAIVLYFNKDIFGSSFYSLHETQHLKQLYHRAERGLKISGGTNERVVTLMREMLRAKDLNRIILLLQILETISSGGEYELLASIGYQNTYDTTDNHKIDSVFQYVSQNFGQDISLEDIAKNCNMTPQSFCRFFKKRTQKTFIDFLNEFRISHAKKLMIENEEMTIREIAFDSGFNSISNFNKIFKSLTAVTPKEYKDMRH